MDDNCTMYICLSAVLNSTVLLLFKKTIFQVYITLFVHEEIIIKHSFNKKILVFSLLKVFLTDDDNDDNNNNNNNNNNKQ